MSTLREAFKEAVQSGKNNPSISVNLADAEVDDLAYWNESIKFLNDNRADGGVFLIPGSYWYGHVTWCVSRKVLNEHTYYKAGGFAVMRCDEFFEMVEAFSQFGLELQVLDVTPTTCEGASLMRVIQPKLC